MEWKNGYKLSRDYKRLKELLDSGYEVVCFVRHRSYGYGVKSVCVARWWEHENSRNSKYEFVSDGFTHLYWNLASARELPNYPQSFDGECEKYEVEFIDIDC